MNRKVDVSLSFFGKPYQTIVTLHSLFQHSRQHIDKVYLSIERQQPHEDWDGIYKVVDFFREKNIRFKLFQPRYFLNPNVNDYERTRSDKEYRQSIMFQHSLEDSDKKYVCVLHNDLLFHGDMIGAMLEKLKQSPEELAGIGSIGQCWSCPASWAKVCTPSTFEQYKPSPNAAIELHEAFDTPRQERDIDVIKAGRVHPLPECRLNEYCCLINIPLYRQNTLPAGDIGCYGGGWDGVDLGTVWSHDMYNRGYRFQHVPLEDYVRHAPFDDSGSGTLSYTRNEQYWKAEANARAYIEKYLGKVELSPSSQVRVSVNRLKRQLKPMVLQALGVIKPASKPKPAVKVPELKE